jgi:V/A-type H+-transporting ATPase subunit F
MIGMRLAGIEGIIVHEVDGVKSTLKKILKTELDIGIVLITEKLVEKCRKYICDFKLRNRRPLIVEIPDRHAVQGRSNDAITKYIREAVGINI